jgi:hypothetical protein
MDSETSKQLVQLLINQNNMMMTHQSNIVNNNKSNKKTKSLLNDFKPLVTINDILDNMEYLPLNNLLTQDLPKFYVRIIMLNLEKINEYKRPLVCSDPQRKKYYYWNGNEWIKSNDFIRLFYKKIFKHYAALFSLQLNKILQEANEQNNLIGKFFDVDKWPIDKLLSKVLILLGSELKISGTDIDSE